MAKKIVKVKVKCNGCCQDNILKAKINPPMAGLPPKIAFNHRHTAKVSLGLDVEVPEGYRLCIALVPNLAERGIVLTNVPGNFTKGPVEAVLLNAGREIVDVSDGDAVVTCWLEQVGDFEWECS